MPDEDDKWESFETYKGPEPLKMPRWLDWTCRILIAIGCLTIVFYVSGFLATFFIYRYAPSVATNLGWPRFFIFGALGVIAVIVWWFRPPLKPGDDE